LEVCKVRERAGRVVDARFRQPWTWLRFNLEDCIPHRFLIDGIKQFVGAFEKRLRYIRIVLAAGAAANHFADFLSALIDAVDGDVMSKAADPRRQADILAGNRTRDA